MVLTGIWLIGRAVGSGRDGCKHPSYDSFRPNSAGTRRASTWPSRGRVLFEVRMPVGTGADVVAQSEDLHAWEHPTPAVCPPGARYAWLIPA